MTILKFENFTFSPSHRKPLSWLQTIKTILIWHGLRTHALEQIGWNETRQSKKAVLREKPIPCLICVETSDIPSMKAFMTKINYELVKQVTHHDLFFRDRTVRIPLSVSLENHE